MPEPSQSEWVSSGVKLGSACLRPAPSRLPPNSLASSRTSTSSRALGALAPDRLIALRRVAAIESVGSSTRMEGSKLSDREVERLLSNPQIKSFATRDEQEVAGYAAVMDLVFSSWPDIALTENHIKQLHRDLLVYSGRNL